MSTNLCLDILFYSISCIRLGNHYGNNGIRLVMHIKIEQIEEGPNIVVCGDASGWFARRLAKPNWQTCSAIYY